MSEPATAAGLALYPATGGSFIASGSSLTTVGGAVQILTIWGVSLGLRPDFLVAGMLGAIASIFLLNSVPLEGAGVLARISNMSQRFFVVVSSAVTSGYLAPLAATAGGLGQDTGMACAFLMGAGARVMLMAYLNRVQANLQVRTAPSTTKNDN